MTGNPRPLLIALVTTHTVPGLYTHKELALYLHHSILPPVPRGIIYNKGKADVSKQPVEISAEVMLLADKVTDMTSNEMLLEPCVVHYVNGSKDLI